MNKENFNNVEEGDLVFGLVFGPGQVRTVLSGYYHFEVEYENGHIVPYTINGIPGWSNDLDFQTVYYRRDIDLMNYDFATTEKILSVKKIIKLRDKDKLEIKCKSGIWMSTNKCPSDYMELMLETNKLYLFRRQK